MVLIKENQNKMNQYFHDLAFHLNNALKENWYHVILGSFYYSIEEEMKNYQIYYQNHPGDDYRNLLEEFWEGTKDELREESLDEVTFLLQDIHDYCQENGDNWSAMTFDFYVNGDFHVDFKYDEISCFDDHYMNMWQADYFKYEEQ